MSELPPRVRRRRDLPPARREAQPAVPRAGPEEVSRLLPRGCCWTSRIAASWPPGMTTYNPDAQPADRHPQGRGHGHRGLSPDASRQVRKPDAGIRGPGRHRARPLCHLRRGRPQLCPAVRAASPARSTSGSASRFNGQLANYQELRDAPARRRRPSPGPRDRHRNHHARDQPRAFGRSAAVAGRGDAAASAADSTGRTAWCSSNALGDMLVARDPLGIKPLCYAMEGPLFAAASESVALLNLGFAPESIQSLLPGQAITIADGQFRGSSGSPERRGGPIASSSGSTSPTSPARWTTAASTCRARRWARNWPGWSWKTARAARRGHDRRAGARHEQGGRRRDGLRTGRAVRWKA